MHDFLSADFARLPPEIMDRCLQADGRRIFLSGATGFFGKNLLSLFAYLSTLGVRCHVTALSRSPESFLAQETWCRALPWLNWQKGDALNPWTCSGKFDLLIHAATETSSEAHADKLTLFEDMVTVSRNALDFAANTGVKRMLLCGSGAQYGAMPRFSSGGFSESDSTACDSARISSAYGEAKRVGEILAALYAQRHDFAVVNTRCFAFVGPGLSLDGHFAIGDFIGHAIKGESIQLSTEGASLRSYLYGSDLSVWLLILLLEAQHGATFNVGSEVPISVADLARRVRDLVCPRTAVRLGEKKNAAEERNVYFPSIARARSLGLDVWTNLDLAITRTAQWNRIVQRP